MQASSPFPNDGNMVDLVLGLVVRGGPSGLVDVLVGKEGSSNDQVIERAEFRKEFAVFILLSSAMLAHDQFSVGVV